MALLALNNIKKSFATRLLFDKVTFELSAREHVGLVGVNGCGKTTLFRIIAGTEAPDEGQVMLSREAKLSYMEQIELNLERTLYESALQAFEPLIEIENQLQLVNEQLERQEGELSGLIARQHSLQTRYEDGGGLTFRSRTRATLLGLGFTEEEFSQPLSTMSGGQRSKAQLARVLLSGANLLLLDEPTNHLDIDSIAFLEEFLSSYSGAFLVISHDRYFLDKVTNRTLELENQHIESTAGNYSRHLELKASEREIAMRHYQRTQREIRRIMGIVEQQRRWGQAHNFITAESKLKQAERLKATLVEPERDPESIRFRFTSREPAGNDVLIAEDLKKSYGSKLLFEHLSFLIKKNERVFLLGPNGCGKTTLLRILTGREEPDAGEWRLGAKVDPGYYDQHMTGLDPNHTALEEVWDAFPRMNHTEVRSALATFLFKGDEVEKKISTLSGGEKARIQLLKLMLSGSNLLLLDEPTNHLDIHSREALERALEDYGGTMLIVTHDRYLVNRLADRILVMEDDGLTEYIGGYDDYLAERAERKAAKEASVKKEEKPQNSYHAQKERQSALNRAHGEVKRAEERISRMEEEIAKGEEELSSSAVSSDYVKAGTLAKALDEKRTELEALYAEWERVQAALEKLEKE